MQQNRFILLQFIKKSLQKFCQKMRTLKTVIAPSILSADFANLETQCRNILNDGADSLHIDIMDGHFVPNLSFGPLVVKALRKKIQDAHFDCHIMVTHPQNYVQDLKQAGCNCITFHYEAQHQGLVQICDSIRNQGMEVGLSIKPKTEISNDLLELIDSRKVDKVLIMTVQPGFGGQKFMQDMMHKVKHLRDAYQWLDIQVDGGISLQTIGIAARNGANSFVAGSAIFGAINKKETVEKMKKIVEFELNQIS